MIPTHSPIVDDWVFWADIKSVLTAVGAYVYSHLGQYSANNIANVIQPVALQTAINYIGLFTAFIACCKRQNMRKKAFPAPEPSNISSPRFRDAQALYTDNS